MPALFKVVTITLTEDQLKTERELFICFLRQQPHFSDAPYDKVEQRFVFDEDEVKWQAWLYRATHLTTFL